MTQLLPVSEHVPPGRTRGLRYAVWTVYALFSLTCFFAVGALLTHWQGIGFSRIVGFVFVLFGVFKIVLAWDAVMAPKAQAPMSDQRTEVGSPGMFRLWVNYKLWAGFLAMVAGGTLMVIGSKTLDLMPTMLMK
jgi:hypothetical protein